MPGAAAGLEAQIIVEVGFSVGASTGTLLQLDDPVRGKLDTGTLAADVTWTDVSDYVLAVSTRRGSNRVTSPTIRYEAGTAAIVLDNSDRRFDPTNLAGPYVAAGVSQVTPMRAVRIRTGYPIPIGAGILPVYDLFRGFADEWRISYDLPDMATVVLTATDGFKVLSNVDRAGGASVGGGELSGARINRILDSAGWPAIDRNIDAGTTAMQATTLSGNVLTELRLVEDSELGQLLMSEAGVVRFVSRGNVLSATRAINPQGTFGDGGGAELAYEAVEVAYDDMTMANRARISRLGSTEQQADDAASQSLYLIRTVKRNGLLMQTDGEASDYAGFMVYTAGQPELRFATMTLFPREDPANLWPQVLARVIGDRITITRRPPGGGTPITRDVFIQGIEHHLDMDWRTTFTLQSATRYNFLILDHATRGLLDTGTLGF